MDQVKWAEAAHHSLRSRGIGRWSGGHGANISDTLASRGGMEENKTAAGIICALFEGEGGGSLGSLGGQDAIKFW